MSEEASSGRPGRFSGFSPPGCSGFLSVHTWFELTLNLGTRLRDFPELTSSENYRFFNSLRGKVVVVVFFCSVLFFRLFFSNS